MIIFGKRLSATKGGLKEDGIDASEKTSAAASFSFARRLRTSTLGLTDRLMRRSLTDSITRSDDVDNTIHGRPSGAENQEKVQSFRSLRKSNIDESFRASTMRSYSYRFGDPLAFNLDGSGRESDENH